MKDRNVGTKGKCPKQDLTIALKTPEIWTALRLADGNKNITKVSHLKHALHVHGEKFFLADGEDGQSDAEDHLETVHQKAVHDTTWAP